MKATHGINVSANDPKLRGLRVTVLKSNDYLRVGNASPLRVRDETGKVHTVPARLIHRLWDDDPQ